MWFFDQSSPYFGWDKGGYAKALAKRLFVTGPRGLLGSFGNLPMFAIISLAWATVMRDRRFLAAGVWFLVLMVMFDFGSSSVISYRPLPLFERYVYPILLPAVVLVSGTLAALLESRAEWGLMKETEILGGHFRRGILSFLCSGCEPIFRERGRSKMFAAMW